MKKVVSLLLVLVLMLALCGCAVSEDAVKEEQNTDAENAEAVSTTVYRTRTGVKYYRNGCQHLSSSKIEQL